jgi:protein-L-isoaspartate O-methyltransferase
MIKKIITRLIPERWKKQLINFKILSVDYAQYKTIKSWTCVNKTNNMIPWYTYPALEYLSNLDFSQKSVFEYGSGYSSIFWSNKAKNVISVEHDRSWIEKIKSEYNSNQTVLLKGNDNDYEKAIAETGKKFDVIIIDGIRRAECSRVVKEYLNKESGEGFMIILDNSDWYKNTAKYLKEELNLIEIDFHGFGPINSYTWTTSIFLSRNFDFKSIKNIQPNFSIAAIYPQDGGNK